MHHSTNCLFVSDEETPTGYLLASGSRDKTIRIWSTSDGKQLQMRKLPTNQGYRRDFGDQNRGKVWTAVCWPTSTPHELISSSVGWVQLDTVCRIVIKDSSVGCVHLDTVCRIVIKDSSVGWVQLDTVCRIVIKDSSVGCVHLDTVCRIVIKDSSVGWVPLDIVL